MNQEVKLDKNRESAVAFVHALSHDGKGIATIAEKITFISGALPGETVTCQITQKRNTWNEARLITILQPAPERMTPPCQHFDICGGCSLQHMDMTTQLQLKQQTLLEQLHHFGNVTPAAILPPLHAHALGYRRKARLGVKYVYKKNRLLMGFHEKSSSLVADLADCPVLHPLFNQHYDALKQLIASLDLYQSIPQVEISIGDEDIGLVFRHLKPLEQADLLKITQFASDRGIHIYLQPNPPESIQKLWPGDNHHRLTYTLPDHGIRFQFHPLDFTQINLEINRLMVNQAIQLLGIAPTDNLLDLFCGIGNFTLPLARHAHHVTGVEGTKDMVARAHENASLNGIANVAFYTANLMETSANVSFLKSAYDKVLLDPPRAGAKEVLAFVPEWGAKRIVYISCNPATLARDAGILVNQHGYQLTHVGIMNMFAHTAHTEAMTVFEI